MEAVKVDGKWRIVGDVNQRLKWLDKLAEIEEDVCGWPEHQTSTDAEADAMLPTIDIAIAHQFLAMMENISAGKTVDEYEGAS